MQKACRIVLKLHSRKELCFSYAVGFARAARELRASSAHVGLNAAALRWFSCDWGSHGEVGEKCGLGLAVNPSVRAQCWWASLCLVWERALSFCRGCPGAQHQRPALLSDEPLCHVVLVGLGVWLLSRRETNQEGKCSSVHAENSTIIVCPPFLESTSDLINAFLEERA